MQSDMRRYETDEPIYGLATGYQKSAIAIFRLSGKGCIELFSKAFSNARRLEKASSGTVIHGYVIEGGERIDEVMVIKYTSGHGYTGEEALEVMCHGSLVIIKRLSVLFEHLSFAQALPGEFTYRAFMHGKMDLVEAEAVEELISSKSETSSNMALMRLSGGLSKEIDNIKGELLDILSSLEVYLDYAEDEVEEEWVYPEEEVISIIGRLDGIASTYNATRIYQEGATVVLAGRTNAGKSSLFNALLKEERAIVSSFEGTTRDYIEADVLFGAVPVRLFDTAGLRESGEAIESEGIRRSRKLITSADLVIYLLEDGEEESDVGNENVLFVHSKSDIRKSDGISFSSITGEGLDELVKKAEEMLIGKAEEHPGYVPISSERERDALLEASSILKESLGKRDLSLDLLVLYFRDALSSLQVLTGEITSDDVLENLFSKFCLGK